MVTATYHLRHMVRLQKRDGSKSTLRISVSWHEIYTCAKVNLYLRQRQSIHCSAVLNLLPVIDASRSYAHLYDTAYISETMNMGEPWHQSYFSRQFIIISEKYRVHLKCLHYMSCIINLFLWKKNWRNINIFLYNQFVEILIKRYVSSWWYCKKCTKAVLSTNI